MRPSGRYGARVKTLLDYAQDHEQAAPDRIYLTQPVGGDAVIEYSWRRVMDEARRMATHLTTMGLSPGDKVAILSKNCAHFIMAELAIWLGGYTTVAIFPTESEKTVRYVLEHSEAKALFVGKLDDWPSQEPGVPDGVKKIALPLAPKTQLPKWDDIIARTEPLMGRVTRPPSDVSMLVYTSGSTGEPKGVMHSFGSVTAGGEGLSKLYGITPDDRLFSYLPLAHVYERALVGACSMVSGAHVFFADSLDTFLADLRRAKPTIFASVPRLWLKFQQGVFTKMPPGRLDMLLSIPIVKGIIAKRVLTGLGLESVRLAASASAPIPAELIAWYRRLGLNLLEGYGMSEDFGYSHGSTVEKRRSGYVGIPYPGVDVRISEEGEVQVRSPARMIGYYKRPDLDAEVFTEDGYFKTGDRGERAPEGLLKITGRVKELFKTAKGKYVAPAPIENKLNEHPRIELSCVSGVGMPSAYALVVLAEDIRPKLGDAAVRAQVESELATWLDSVNQDLSAYEQLQMIVVAKEPWTIENGMLTPTMKIKRARIEAAVEPLLEGWFAKKSKVVWA